VDRTRDRAGAPRPPYLVPEVRRGDGAAANKAAHLVIGVDTDGVKHGLGIWVQSAETVWPNSVTQTCVVPYTDLRIMPMWSLMLCGAGFCAGEVGIIRWAV
jgi:hypothetical protein